MKSFLRAQDKAALLDALVINFPDRSGCILSLM